MLSSTSPTGCCVAGGPEVLAPEGYWSETGIACQLIVSDCTCYAMLCICLLCCVALFGGGNGGMFLDTHASLGLRHLGMIPYGLQTRPSKPHRCGCRHSVRMPYGLRALGLPTL